MTIQEMVARIKERNENNPEFQKRIADFKAKAEAEKTAREQQQAQARAKFAEMIAKIKAAKVEQTKAIDK
jgi:hypothetical protein